MTNNPQIHFLPVKGVSHFSILALTNERIAAKILRDDGPTSGIDSRRRSWKDAESERPPGSD